MSSWTMPISARPGDGSERLVGLKPSWSKVTVVRRAPLSCA